MSSLTGLEREDAGGGGADRDMRGRMFSPEREVPQNAGWSREKSLGMGGRAGEEGKNSF
jgi:hypothetical protein